jgi:hypothetical protein
MNDPANTTQWLLGSLVIHDADAKRATMLMVVLRYGRDGLVQTRYLDQRLPQHVYVNPVDALHDPARFGIALPQVEGGRP